MDMDMVIWRHPGPGHFLVLADTDEWVVRLPVTPDPDNPTQWTVPPEAVLVRSTPSASARVVASWGPPVARLGAGTPPWAALLTSVERREAQLARPQQPLLRAYVDQQRRHQAAWTVARAWRQWRGRARLQTALRRLACGQHVRLLPGRGDLYLAAQARFQQYTTPLYYSRSV